VREIAADRRPAHASRALTRWRQRLGAEQIAALLQERPFGSASDPCELKDLEGGGGHHRRYGRAICAWPSEPPSWWSATLAPTSSKRARRELKFLRTRLGSIVRDIRRKIEGARCSISRCGFAIRTPPPCRPSSSARRRRRRAPTEVYSLHAPTWNVSAAARRALRTSSAARSINAPNVTLKNCKIRALPGPQ
jgi:hypothetical protein